ncbi:cupin domain-containing protein [Myroides odoratimimus]|uniref:cupin domain-containing protein n=1 Tax=Myroides odoratimimus TaxID=76832 RepID=UPI0004688CF9|nr:cupin domain-containing protein [Myroides odoratimimus]
MKNILKSISAVFCIGAMLVIASCTENKNQDKTTELDKTGIFKRGEQLSADLITGKAWHNKLVDEDSIYATSVGVEEFEIGSRNVWHSHPSGQIIIVLDGVGYHQIKGQPLQVLRKGEVAKCPPGILHWHGASKDSSVTQIYILPNTEKGLADWSNRVMDEEYNNASKAH